MFLAVSHVLHVAPQLVNVAALVRQAVVAEEQYIKAGLFVAAADDLSGSVLIKVLLVPAMANGIRAVGAAAAGTQWRWTNQSMESVTHYYESLLLVFSTVLFSGGYHLLQSQPPPHINSAFDPTSPYSRPFGPMVELACKWFFVVNLSFTRASD